MSDDSPEQENGVVGSPAKKPPSKKLTVEKIYQKKSQLEHILLRPDTYIGLIFQFKLKQYSCLVLTKLSKTVELKIDNSPHSVTQGSIN